MSARRLAAAGLAAVLVCAADAPAGHFTLEVATADRVVWSAAVAEGDGFDIAFTHSAERCRWTQHYEVAASRIRQIGSTFGCFGAGMPALTPPSRTTRDGYTVPAPARLSEIPMMNWAPAEITLTTRAGTVHLGPRMQDFEAFRVRVR